MNSITILLIMLSLLGQALQSYAANSMNSKITSKHALMMSEMDHSSMDHSTMDHSTMDHSDKGMLEASEMEMDCCDTNCECPPNSCSISSGFSAGLFNAITPLQKRTKLYTLIDTYQPQARSFINNSLYRPPITL